MKLGCAALLLAASVAAVPAAHAEGMEGNTQFLIGQRFLDDFWRPLDEPTTFGVEVDFAPEGSPVHVALGFSVGGDQASVGTPFLGQTGDVFVGFLEMSAGFVWLPVRKAIVRPYLGAGVTMMYTGTGTDWGDFNDFDTDHSFGFYGNLGIYFKVGEHFNIGMDGRIVRGTDVTAGGIDADADYEQASILIGFSWGD